MSAAQPLVSVGMPVYNGERYLRGALDSILEQTYPALEVVISDNASTDATEAICREYAARDPRVRYLRQPRNGGAVWNFNQVAGEARGTYFMWAAFDDLRHPDYVSRCVDALERAPEAVLCCSGVALIDEDGRELEESGYLTRGIRPVGPSVFDRVRALARATYWYDFYGLIRASALARTRGCRPVWGFDLVLLLELCLLGEVVAVPEPLFRYRRFAAKTGQQTVATLSPTASDAPRIPLSWSDLATEMIAAVWGSRHPVRVKAGLTRLLVAEFCLDNWLVRGGIFEDGVASAGRAWRSRRYGRSAGLLSVYSLVFTRLAVARATAAASPRPRPDA